MADQAVRPPAQEQAGKGFKFSLRGGFAATRAADGAEVTPRGRKARALLAYLLLERRPVDRDRLAGLLWSERGQAQARASLRQCLLELRDFTQGETPLLRIGREGAAADPARAATDLEELLDLARRGAADALADRLANGGGMLLQGLDGIDPAFDEWLRSARTERSDALLAAAQQCARRALDEGEADAACRLTQAVQAMDPLDETVARLAMEVGGRLGRRDYVQRVYDRLVHDLGAELGVEPSAETQALRGKLLNGHRSDAPQPVVGEATSLSPASERTVAATASRRRRWWAVAAILLLLGAALSFVWLQERRTTEPAPESLAVLPFRSLAPGDDYFAEGVAEEILTRLSHEPGLHVAGRTSSWQFKDRAVDVGEIGRRLDVSHILEGSVRSAGDRVRVDVALVRTGDGVRLWSQGFDGRLDDIFAIQDRIGGSVAGALRRKLVHSAPRTGSLATSGQVYSLYLTARGLIRERNPTAFAAARHKLRQAVALDPNFAPAWSSLAQTENWTNEDSKAKATREHAIALARKALTLAPDLAEAHGVLGMLYDFGHPLGQHHIKRAAALDPNNAEFQFWLGHVYGAEADFPRMLAAYRRAVEIDPLWGYAQEYAVTSAWQLGYRDEALGYVRRVESDGSRYQAHMIRAVLAEARGDFSEEAREYGAARAATGDAGKRMVAQYLLGTVFWKLGLSDAAEKAWSSINPQMMGDKGGETYAAVRRGALPTIAELRRHNRSAPYFFEDKAYTAIAAKHLINAGRARDVLALYDSDGGILQMSNRSLPAPPASAVEDGPIVAAALRAGGREGEARRILAHLDGLIGAGLRRSNGRALPSFLISAAQVWAMRGKHEAASAALERAMRNGWANARLFDYSGLPDIGDEPTFRSLRGQPRFERIRARLNEHRARERREVAQVRL